MRLWSVLDEAQRSLGAGRNGLPDAIFDVGGHVRSQDVQVVVVIEVEDLGDDADTYGVRFTRVRIDDDLHDYLPLFASGEPNQRPAHTFACPRWSISPEARNG